MLKLDVKKVRNNSRKVKKIIKKISLHVVLCMTLLFVIIGIYFYIKAQIFQYKARYIEDDFSLMYQIENVEIKEEKLVLSGWLFELDKESNKNKYDIILHDMESGNNYFTKIKNIKRKDVNDYFLCEYDYSNCGWVATIPLKKLDLWNNNYQIIIRYNSFLLLYKTEVYLNSGKLMYANPEEYKPLSVEGTALEKIVKEGVLRIYRPDVGVYVYQQGMELVLYCGS